MFQDSSSNQSIGGVTSGFCQTADSRQNYCPSDGHKFENHHGFCPVCGRTRGYLDWQYQLPQKYLGTSYTGLGSLNQNINSNQTLGGYDKDRDNPFPSKLGSIK